MSKNTEPVSAVWLCKAGEYVEVRVELDNQWRVIIREHVGGSFSHIAEALAFREGREMAFPKDASDDA